MVRGSRFCQASRKRQDRTLDHTACLPEPAKSLRVPDTFVRTRPLGLSTGQHRTYRESRVPVSRCNACWPSSGRLIAPAAATPSCARGYLWSYLPAPHVGRIPCKVETVARESRLAAALHGHLFCSTIGSATLPAKTPARGKSRIEARILMVPCRYPSCRLTY